MTKKPTIAELSAQHQATLDRLNAWRQSCEEARGKVSKLKAKIADLIQENANQRGYIERIKEQEIPPERRQQIERRHHVQQMPNYFGGHSEILGSRDKEPAWFD